MADEATKDVGMMKDADGYIDLTGIANRRFRFKYLKTNDDGTQVEVKQERDVEWVLIQLRQNIPTAFQPASDGKGINLFRVIVLHLNGDPIPDDLPSMAHVVVAVKAAMDLPADFPTSHAVTLLQMFLVELVGLETLKKEPPDSPA